MASDRASDRASPAQIHQRDDHADASAPADSAPAGGSAVSTAGGAEVWGRGAGAGVPSTGRAGDGSVGEADDGRRASDCGAATPPPAADGRSAGAGGAAVGCGVAAAVASAVGLAGSCGADWGAGSRGAGVVAAAVGLATGLSGSTGPWADTGRAASPGGNLKSLTEPVDWAWALAPARQAASVSRGIKPPPVQRK